eukprot:365619-Chlamydomonas_euryale.AAC.10
MSAAIAVHMHASRARTTDPFQCVRFNTRMQRRNLHELAKLLLSLASVQQELCHCFQCQKWVPRMSHGHLELAKQGGRCDGYFRRKKVCIQGGRATNNMGLGMFGAPGLLARRICAQANRLPASSQALSVMSVCMPCLTQAPPSWIALCNF